MKFLRRALITAPLLAALGASAQTVGQPAPALQALDTAGKAVNLADFKGKTVVLEWVNPECPFVKKHYSSGNMQSLQKSAAADGVIWLTVASGAVGAEGYLPPSELAAWTKKVDATPTATLMDADGKVGRAWGAKTTPHMYIVNTAGALVYAGAIDSKPSNKAADIAGATNYVKQALAEIKAGQPVSKTTTAPYGCGVKYAS